MKILQKAFLLLWNVAFYTVYWMFSLAIVAVALVFVILNALFSNKEANTSS